MKIAGPGQQKLIGELAYRLMRGIAASLRMKLIDRGEILQRTERPPVILAFWHDHLFLASPFFQRYFPGRTSIALISRSRDGDFVSQLVGRFGVGSARGSSSRHGGAAARAVLLAAQNRLLDIAMTPDGPRGPRHVVQPGVLRLAQATGRPIVAVHFRLGWKLRLKSWDRFQIPLPFSTCHFFTSPPLSVPPVATEAELNELALQLEKLLGND